MLLIGPNTFDFSASTNLKILKKYIARCAIWMRNTFSYIKVGMQAKGI